MFLNQDLNYSFIKSKVIKFSVNFQVEFIRNQYKFKLKASYKNGKAFKVII